MNSLKRLVLILGDQLDLKGAALRDFDFKTDEVVMIESIPEAQYVWSHKAKIALFLSAMRHFAKSLKELNYPLEYIQASSLSIVAVLKEKITQELPKSGMPRWLIRKLMSWLPLLLRGKET